MGKKKTTPPAEPTDTQMKTYNVLTPIRHNGTRYLPGSTIELGEKHATPLLACAAISSTPSTKSTSSTKTKDPAA